MPERTTKDDLLTRDAMLLFFLFRNRGHQGSISKLAVDELGYADDSAVNRRIHELEDKGLVRERKEGPGYELTKAGRERIQTLTFPRSLTLIILLMSVGTVIWGLDGILFSTPIYPIWILCSGVAFTAMSLVILSLQLRLENSLLGPKLKSVKSAGKSEEEQVAQNQGPDTVAE